jgi:hypothetical protein
VTPVLKYGIIENTKTVRRIRIGRFWGVTILVTSLTWLGPLVFFSLNFLINLLDTKLTLADRLYQSLIFAIAVELTTLLHAFGHIQGGKLVHSAMDELLITSTRGVNLYHGDQSLVPGHVHLVRALGGPLLNLIAAGVLVILASPAGTGFSSDLIDSLIVINLFFGLGSFLPIRTVDGEVIWREIFRFVRPRAQQALKRKETD